MSISKDILASLSYFDMFDYPLKKREIFLFLNHEDKEHQIDHALESLVNASQIHALGEFYSLHNNYALAEKRKTGNEKAALMLKKANNAAAIIARFPFVKGVGVSGSLSKNYADDSADVDFFIITSANRLWIARTILHLFKKCTFLFNKQHLFCMNYFIDEAELRIVEKNIYTATEITTLLPMYGPGVFENFFSANKWTKNFLPNNYMRVSSAKEIAISFSNRILQHLLNNRPGNLLDTFLMKLTVLSWNKKTRLNKRNVRGVVMSLHASKHFAKPDPGNFQQSIIKLYKANLDAVLYEHEQSLKLTKALF